MRSSPYALPGLCKVTVFGPRRQDEHYRGEWQNTGVVHVRSNSSTLSLALYLARLEAAKKSLRNAPQQKTYHHAHCLL
jgi:hypothetical protein